MSKGEVVSVNISKEKGTVKTPTDGIVIDERGIVGDAHAGAWRRQVSLLGKESADKLAQELGREIAAGEFAENITVRGLDLSHAGPLDRFRIGRVELEVTQIGKECHGDGCAIFREVGKCVMPKEGVFCRVIHGGTVKPGDAVEYFPKTVRFKIITMSDRAYGGDYPDKSGPRIVELLSDFKPWRASFDSTVLPDDRDRLRAELISARDSGVDIVFTTGGTGVGPRDITPEVVMDFCDKIIPGIMEQIRVKYGSENPKALLSRSVAGLAGETIVYALPGSVRAVEEYMVEILRTLEHLIYMVHGLDVH